MLDYVSHTGLIIFLEFSSSVQLKNVLQELQLHGKAYQVCVQQVENLGQNDLSQFFRTRPDLVQELDQF